MFNLFKTKNVEVLSELKGNLPKKKIAEQIVNLQTLFRGSYSPAEFYGKHDWFFIRKDNKITTAIGLEFLRKVKIGEKTVNVYAISDFVNVRNYKNLVTKADSDELTELFSKIVKYAKKSPHIDYLVCVIPQKLNARPLARAGFNAKIFNKASFHSSGLIDNLRDQIIIANQDNLKEKLSKDEILAKMRAELHLWKTLFKKGRTPKSLGREIRIIQENKNFIERSNEKDAYFGLIVGLNTKK